MEPVYWIEHKGKKILFSAYSNLTAEELIETVTRADTECYPNFKDLPSGSVLSLADVTESVASKDGVNALKKSVQLWSHLYRKQAVYGVSAFQHIFLNAINKFTGSSIRAFNSKREAMEWLISD